MVQPIDMQSLVGGIMNADRVQHIVERQAAQEQQRAAFQEHAERAQQETQIQETTQTESERIEEDQERESQRRRQQRKSDEQKDDEKQSAAEGHHEIVSKTHRHEESEKTRTVYNSHEETEDLDGPEGFNLDVTV